MDIRPYVTRRQMKRLSLGKLSGTREGWVIESLVLQFVFFGRNLLSQSIGALLLQCEDVLSGKN